MLAGCDSWLVALWVACRAGGLLVGRCLAVCGGRPLPLRAPVRFGRGVRPYKGSLPLLFVPFLPVWFPPLAAVFRLWRMWGFCFLALLGCWSRQVVLSPFLGGSVSFPLFYLVNSMYPRYLQDKIRFFFGSFASIHTIRNNLI